MRAATFLALAFGAVVASKAVGYATAYPSAVERSKLAASFGNNVGLSALLGRPRHIDLLTGFTAWNTLGVMVIIGSIWAFLLATRTFRGEETAGRWELLLAGQTTRRQAAANTLAGLGCSLVVLYAVTALAFASIGRLHTVNFTTRSALFFALVAVAAPALFMAVGSVASQLMPTRGRAAAFTAGVFGASFLLRAMGDITSAHWLLDITPLGWIEQLQPLYGSQPLWLLPIAMTILCLAILTIVLAGRRDLGASTFADKDTAQPKTKLLNTPLTMAFRLARAKNLSWLVAIAWVSTFFSLLTKSALQAFSSSPTAEQAISRVAHSSRETGATVFLGVVFFLLMTLLMAYAASAVGAIREDEAEGYVDNLLVRPVGRLRWLGGRIALICMVIVAACLIISLCTWASVTSQHLGITYRTLLLASINAVIPALFVLGLGVVTFGARPRLTTIVAFGAVAWSFLLQMVSSGINLNHWLLDTSVLHHLSLAPAANPNWKSVISLASISLVLSIIGMAAFKTRDLATE